jgi:hypothetical protein
MQKKCLLYRKYGQINGVRCAGIITVIAGLTRSPDILPFAFRKIAGSDQQ